MSGDLWSLIALSWTFVMFRSKKSEWWSLSTYSYRRSTCIFTIKFFSSPRSLQTIEQQAKVLALANVWNVLIFEEKWVIARYTHFQTQSIISFYSVLQNYCATCKKQFSVADMVARAGIGYRLQSLIDGHRITASYRFNLGQTYVP